MVQAASGDGVRLYASVNWFEELKRLAPVGGRR
jgi:hypothetical protein